MQVLFLKNVKGIGKIGDIKEVSDGYARNFLLPNKIAKLATQSSHKESENLAKKRELEDIKNKKQALAVAEKLKGEILEIKSDANSEGNLYGSVGQRQIVDEVKNKYKISLEQSQIDLSRHIKKIGDYEVPLNLDQTIATTLIIRVLPS